MGKKVVWLGVLFVLLLLIGWTAVAAASIGSEASNLDTMLKQSIQIHEPMSSVMQKVTAMGFQMKQDAASNNSQSAAMSGRGPDHWAVIYKTWLTLKVDSDPNAGAQGYHIDREGSLF